MPAQDPVDTTKSDVTPTTRRISLKPADDDVRGTFQYVIKTASGAITTELLPGDAKVGDRYLCAEDQGLYAVKSVGPLVLELKGYKAPRLEETWDGLPPVDGDPADAGDYPDASYFGGGPIYDDGSDVWYYVHVNADGEVVVTDVETLVPQKDYAAISTLGKTAGTAAVGGSATKANIDKVLAITVEQDYSSGSPKPLIDLTKVADADKLSLAVFYGIVSAAKKTDGTYDIATAKWTESGAVGINRVTVNDQANPAPTVGDPAAAWTADPFSQPVDFETGTNQSIGFRPGRR